MKGTLQGQPSSLLLLNLSFMAAQWVMSSVKNLLVRGTAGFVGKYSFGVFFCNRWCSYAREALISLMQMAKTSAVIERLKQQGTPYISL